jgi:hypothetical protein
MDPELYVVGVGLALLFFAAVFLVLALIGSKPKLAVLGVLMLMVGVGIGLANGKRVEVTRATSLQNEIDRLSRSAPIVMGDTETDITVQHVTVNGQERLLFCKPMDQNHGIHCDLWAKLPDPDSVAQ